MITWVRSSRVVNKEGTTVTYFGLNTKVLIQSRKRHIPHTNGVGTWDNTTFWVIDHGREVQIFYTLKEAKEFAETYWKEINA